MPDWKALLEAFVHGGAQYGQLREKRAIETDERERAKRKDLLEFAILQQRQQREQEPTRYATHEGRTYDMRDPRQRAAYEKAIRLKTGATDRGDWDQVIGPDGSITYVNPRTQQTRPVPGVKSRTPAGAAANPVNWQTVQGDDGFYQVNPETGQTRPVGGIRPKPPTSVPGGAPTQGERQVAAVLPRAEEGMRIISELTQQAGGAPGVSTMLTGFLGRRAQSAEAQRFNAAARAVVSSILRAESGATITEDEITSMMGTMVPQPGDKPETVAQKLDMLKRQVDALKASAGRALPDAPTGRVGTGTVGAPKPAPRRAPF